jgi:predicted acyltransferase
MPAPDPQAAASDAMAPVAAPDTAPAARLASLDAFRGGVILLMLLVNAVGQDVFTSTAGNGRAWADAFPAQLFHAYRSGGRLEVTLADLVFPWFMLIVGVSVAFSMTRGRGRGLGPWGRVAAALRRSVILYALGCLIHAAQTAPEVPLTWRIALTTNVLTEIAAAYFLGVLAFHLPRGARAGVVAAVLLGKWALLRHVPPPAAAGSGQDMLAYLRAHAAPLASLLTLSGRASIVVIGTIAGEALAGGARGRGAAAGLMGAGVALALVALAWRLDCPFDHLGASPSYALLGAGTGLALLGAAYGAIDAGRWVSARPLVVVGLNPIAVYVTVELLWPMVLTRWKAAGPGGAVFPLALAAAEWVGRATGPVAAAWLLAAAYVGLCWQGARWLSGRGIYIKV